MKKSLLILLISLLLPMLSFSKDTYPKIVADSLIVITPIQLKQTNLIFLEHAKLIKEFKLVSEKLRLQEETIEAQSKSLVLKDEQLFNLKSINGLQQVLIEDQDKIIEKYRKRKTVFIVGGCTIGVSFFVLGLLL